MSDPFDTLDPALAETLRKRGFSSLTPVQERVLSDAASGADLRISSQTGSGKTVAVGLVMARDWAAQVASETAPDQNGDRKSPAAPWAALIAPTRELANQVHKELSWLLAPLGVKLVCCTGGTNVSLDRRALAGFRGILVGTPGRVCDHLRGERLVLSSLHTLVLDEADQMLDLGFREELDAIVQGTPPERRTHFVSATFRDEVGRLAERYQKSAKQIQGTPLGAANSDIEHVVHIIRERDTEAAVVNLLLCAGNRRTLVFARTRADVATIVERLTQRGFAAAAISGDLAQAQRDRALAAFQRGTVPILIATDVASRGIHVEDIELVIQAEAPRDPEVYIHRSGRTGRAGNKGRSILLVPDRAVRRAQRMFQEARIKPSVQPVPTLNDVIKAQDERVLSALAAPGAPPERFVALAKQLCESTDPELLVATLLADNKTFGGPCSGMPIVPIASSPHDTHDRPRTGAKRGTPAPGQFVPFFVNWGQQHGATAARVLSMACRRGGVESHAIGAIRVGDRSTIIEVHADIAETFGHKATQTDTRDPNIKIRVYDASKPLPGAAASPRTSRAAAPRAEVKKFGVPPVNEAAAPPVAQKTGTIDAPGRKQVGVSVATARQKIDACGSAVPQRFDTAKRSDTTKRFNTTHAARAEQPVVAGTGKPRKFDAAAASKVSSAAKPRKKLVTPATSRLSPAAKARKKLRKAEKRAQQASA